MLLSLTRPLVFFDLETTGVNISQDRIVELSLVKQLPDGSLATHTWRINPEMPIPAQATAVHHISNEDVAQCPTFKDIAHDVIEFIADCDLAGYNSNHFDVPLLQEELLRAGIDVDLRSEHRLVDAFVIFQKHTPRTLTAAYKHYCGKDLEGAHGANADTLATREVLLAQLEQHKDVPHTIEELEQYTTMSRTADLAGRLGYDEKGEVIFNFGKYKGRRVKEVFLADPSYYSWMSQGDFPLYTKRIITQLREELSADKKAAKQQQHNTLSSQPAAGSHPQGGGEPTEDDLNKLRAAFPAKHQQRKASNNQPPAGKRKANNDKQPTLFSQQEF